MPRRFLSYTASFSKFIPLKTMRPEWNVVWPMMVERSVVLPTPLRPRMASAPRSGSSRSISSRITVAPYPARTRDRERSGRLSMLRLAQVDVVHALVAGDLLRRPFHQHLALHQHRDAPREAEHQVHVVLDDEDGDVLRQLVEVVEDLGGIFRRHAGRGLVEQQDLGLQPERDGYLDQALLAVGEIGYRRRRLVGETQRGQQFPAFIDDFLMRGGGTPHPLGNARAFGDAEGDVVQDGEAAEQGGDLERAPQAAPH